MSLPNPSSGKRMRYEQITEFEDGPGRENLRPSRATSTGYWTNTTVPVALFIFLSAIWGTTWIAIKHGVATIPPFAFAGSRFVAAGGLLILVAGSSAQLPKLIGKAPKLVLVGLLLITFCYGPLFWGMQFVSSGLSALVNLALIPVGLVLIGCLLRQEVFSRLRGLGLVLGVLGLTLLFFGRSSSESAGLAGVAAITIGTLSGCTGTILSRAWLSDLSPALQSGILMLIGGMGLLLCSVALEGIHGWSQISFSTAVIASWAYLTFFGSLIAFTIYMYLVQTWGAFRSGLYAFVSPVVALASGYFVFDERLAQQQLLGCFLLLIAAAAAMVPAGARRLQNPTRSERIVR